MNRGRLSIEQLFHFQCSDCKKWWAIGDAIKRRLWFCPWCGREQSFILKKGANQVKC